MKILNHQRIPFELRKESILLLILLFLSLHFNYFIQTVDILICSQTSLTNYSKLNNFTPYSFQNGSSIVKNVLHTENSLLQKIQHQTISDVNLYFTNNFESIFITYNTKFQKVEMFYWNGNIRNSFIL